MNFPQKTAKNRAVERIVALLDVSSDIATTLESAAQLASRLDAELLTLVVQDERLAKLEGHRMVRIIELPTGLCRSAEGAAFRSSWRALGDRIRRTHHRLTIHYRIRGRFERLREFSVEGMRHFGHRSDLFVVGAAGRPLLGRLRGPSRAEFLAKKLTAPVVFAGSQLDTLGSVVVFFDGSEASRKGLELAVDMVNSQSALLTLFVDAGVDEASLRTLENNLVQWRSLAEGELRVYLRRVEALSGCGRAIGNSLRRADLVVLPKPAGMLGLGPLFEGFESPIVVMRPSSGSEAEDEISPMIIEG